MQVLHHSLKCAASCRVLGPDTNICPVMQQTCTQPEQPAIKSNAFNNQMHSTWRICYLFVLSWFLHDTSAPAGTHCSRLDHTQLNEKLKKLIIRSQQGWSILWNVLWKMLWKMLWNMLKLRRVRLPWSTWAQHEDNLQSSATIIRRCETHSQRCPLRICKSVVL